MKVSSLAALLTPCGGGFLPSHCFLPLTVITTATVMIATLTTLITAAMTQSLCNHMPQQKMTWRKPAEFAL